MSKEIGRKPSLRFPLAERPASRPVVALNDAFDLVVRHYGGHVLLCVGVLAFGVSLAGYYRLLPPPFSAPIFPRRCIGCDQLTFLSWVLLRASFPIVFGGLLALPSNRRNRLADRRSASRAL
jgi:hypothetical protein